MGQQCLDLYIQGYCPVSTKQKPSFYRMKFHKLTFLSLINTITEQVILVLYSKKKWQHIFSKKRNHSNHINHNESESNEHLCLWGKIKVSSSAAQLEALILSVWKASCLTKQRGCKFVWKGKGFYFTLSQELTTAATYGSPCKPRTYVQFKMA